MPDERAPWEQASPTAGYGDRPDDLAELRELILAPSGGSSRSWSGGSRLPASPARSWRSCCRRRSRSARGAGRQLVRALAPTVESALGESVRRNPRPIATAIFPVLGPSIRKAIAEALTTGCLHQPT